MGLRQLRLKRAYDSSVDDILNEFYIPVLSNSKCYKRITGFFSSTSLAMAARGISKFIVNRGKIKIISGVKLTQTDIEAIVKGIKEPQKVIEESSIRNIGNITDEFVKDHINALAWMVANNLLEIKIALPTINNMESTLNNIENINAGIFHQKIGILEDENSDKISFSGSINETGLAWTYNIEEFKVFRSWIDQEEAFLQLDNEKFETYWKGGNNKVKTYDIPAAVEEKLIQILGDTNLDDIIKRLQKWELIPLNKPKGEIIINSKGQRIELREYQVAAIDSWIKHGCRGIIEMATGTGKTYVALGCINRLKKDVPNLIVVITVPYKHLLNQWERNLKEWDYNGIQVSSEEPNWQQNIANAISDANNRYRNILIIITTHTTFSRSKFIRAISNARIPILLIADEVHGLGSSKRKKGLLECYKYRLGLSATPQRLFDYEGSKMLSDYFGNIVFTFTIRQAIDRGILTPYYYYPYFIELTQDESKEYLEYTRRIAKQHALIKKDEDNKEARELLKKLRIKRKKIATNTPNKFAKLTEILENIQPNKVNKCIIYCSDEQIDKVQQILIKQGIIHHKFTAKEDNNERKNLLHDFEAGIYQALVAMRCLDEGVDIPPAETAIMLASSTNSREFIQRRGRILRLYNGKKYAYIHDLVVIPTFTPYEENIFNVKSIVKTELRRVIEFAESAINSAEVLNNVRTILSYYGLDIDSIR